MPKSAKHALKAYTTLADDHDSIVKPRRRRLLALNQTQAIPDVRELVQRPNEVISLGPEPVVETRSVADIEVALADAGRVVRDTISHWLKPFERSLDLLERRVNRLDVHDGLALRAGTLESQIGKHIWKIQKIS